MLCVELPNSFSNIYQLSNFSHLAQNWCFLHSSCFKFTNPIISNQLVHLNHKTHLFFLLTTGNDFQIKKIVTLLQNIINTICSRTGFKCINEWHLFLFFDVLDITFFVSMIINDGFIKQNFDPGIWKIWMTLQFRSSLQYCSALRCLVYPLQVENDRQANAWSTGLPREVSKKKRWMISLKNFFTSFFLHMQFGFCSNCTPLDKTYKNHYLVRAYIRLGCNDHTRRQMNSSTSLEDIHHTFYAKQ